MFFKFSSFLLLFWSFQLSESLHQHESNGIFDHVPFSWFRRNKRETDSANCVNACLNNMRDALKQFDHGKRNTGVMNIDMTVSMDLPVFCPNVYQPTKKCLDRCPFDTNSYLVTSSLGPLNFICVDNYTEAISSWPCAEKVLKEVKGVCEQPCKQITSSPNIGGGQLKTNLSGSYTLNCRVTQCELKCQLPKIQSKCSAKSVKFIRALTKSGFDSAQKVNAALSGNQNAPWPTECKDIQQYLA